MVVKPGQVVLLENCRVNKGEKKNDEALAQEDGGAVRHLRARCLRHRAPRRGLDLRHRAVRQGGLRRPAAGGRDRRHHEGARAPKRPLLAIVAGSKVSTKLSILQSLATKVDGLIVGGGIANTFLLAEGLPIGKSLAEPALLDEAKAVIAAMKARGAAVPIPVDVVTAKDFKADAPATVKAVADVAADDLILDIGPKTAAMLAQQLKAAGTIVWNGPVGVFEFDAFAHGTETVARAIAASSAFSIAGGGDTLAAIAKYGIESDVSYISTGGGAFLEVLEGKTLPAFEILARRAGG